MRELLCKIFSFLKYILLIVSFGLVFYGIINTYGRLEKPLTEAISIFVPFGVVLLLFLINLFTRSKYTSTSLLFNFVSVFAFVVIIIICLRSMFDTNMILFHRYGIDYNPSFFADNLEVICAMLYMIGASNVILLICDILDKDKKNKKHKNTTKTDIKKNKEDLNDDEKDN